jgi:hypothetical protein
MGQFVNVNGDYNIKTLEGSQIKLDTGPGVGTVKITGNLIVEGDTLTVSAENLNVNDNVIIVNYGETGAGVTMEYAGIQVDRGTLTPSSLVYDEAADVWLIGHGTTPGPFNYADSGLRVRKIVTNTDTDSGDLTLIGQGIGVVKVTGTLNYEQQITDDDDIPNKKYVDDAIQSNPTFQILRGTGRVVSFDSTDPLDVGDFPLGPYTNQPTESQIGVVVSDKTVTSFFENRVEIGGLSIFTEDPTPYDILMPDAVVLQASNTNANIKLETTGTGKVQTSYAVQLDQINVVPASVSGSVLLYSSTPGIGTSGLNYVTTQRTDELIGKNKALLFSMIF